MSNGMLLPGALTTIGVVVPTLVGCLNLEGSNRFLVLFIGAICWLLAIYGAYLTKWQVGENFQKQMEEFSILKGAHLKLGGTAEELRQSNVELTQKLSEMESKLERRHARSEFESFMHDKFLPICDQAVDACNDFLYDVQGSEQVLHNLWFSFLDSNDRAISLLAQSGIAPKEEFMGMLNEIKEMSSAFEYVLAQSKHREAEVLRFLEAIADFLSRYRSWVRPDWNQS